VALGAPERAGHVMALQRDAVHVAVGQLGLEERVRDVQGGLPAEIAGQGDEEDGGEQDLGPDQESQAQARVTRFGRLGALGKVRLVAGAELCHVVSVYRRLFPKPEIRTHFPRSPLPLRAGRRLVFPLYLLPPARRGRDGVSSTYRVLPPPCGEGRGGGLVYSFQRISDPEPEDSRCGDPSV